MKPMVMTMPKTIIIIILVVLVSFSAFFSGTEIVFAKVNTLRLKRKVEAGSKSAERALYMAQNFPVLISTILIGNNLVNIGASSLATILFTQIWGASGALYAGLIMTGIILTFGEILPKIIFSKYCVGASMIFALPIKIISYIFKPLVFVITKFIDWIAPIWTPKNDNEEEDTSGEELINMIEAIEEKGLIDTDTKELVTSAIELKDVTAHEIMKPRVDVYAVNIDDDLDDILKHEDIFTYSRILVYEGTIDKIVGILNTKKLIIEMLAKREVDLRKMLTQPIYVHKTKLLTSILKVFKQTKTHIAVVVDEFGGTLGIITLEDVLEEVVGDIWDEMDTIEEEFVQTSNDEFLVDGDMNIYDMFELVDYEDDDFESAYSTVAGWCTEQLDDFPKQNDTFTFKNFQIIILEVSGVRVEKIKIVKKEIEE